MRPGRVAVLSALPVLALLGSLRDGPVSPATSPVAGAGTGAVSAVEIRVAADGRPQVVQLPRTRPTAPRAPLPSPAVQRPATPQPVSVRAVTTSPAPAAVRAPRSAPVADGYPYAADTTWAADPWGFTKRQCVSYAAWRLAELGRPLDNARDNWGSALDWDDAARRLGVAITTRPVVGSVAHWDAHERGDHWSSAASAPDGYFVAGAVGHVAWVTTVYADGSVLVAQYNGSGDRRFSTMRVKAPRYLQA